MFIYFFSIYLSIYQYDDSQKLVNAHTNACERGKETEKKIGSHIVTEILIHQKSFRHTSLKEEHVHLSRMHRRIKSGMPVINLSPPAVSNALEALERRRHAEAHASTPPPPPPHPSPCDRSQEPRFSGVLFFSSSSSSWLDSLKFIVVRIRFSSKLM